MSKLALIGDPAIQQYSVSDRLWELISIVIDRKFRFSVKPLETDQDAEAFFSSFRKDKNFQGFTIAPRSWEETIASYIDTYEDDSTTDQVSIVYRDKDGTITGADIRPKAAQRAIESAANLYKCKSVLVLGSKGSGLAIAQHLAEELDKQVCLYDPSQQEAVFPGSVERLESLRALASRQYDLIINATALGRYYANKQMEAFTSPLDLETLQEIVHPGTVIFETNYLPAATLLVQMARHLDLPVITGERMLVFVTVESARRFFGITLDENTIQMLIDEISDYIADREQQILGEAF